MTSASAALDAAAAPATRAPQEDIDARVTHQGAVSCAKASHKAQTELTSSTAPAALMAQWLAPA
jgi:hypothetical protein